MKKTSVENKFTKEGTSSAAAQMPEKGELMKKKNTAAGNNWGKKANTPHNMINSGARYGVTVKLSGGTSPEAGLTQANGRIIAPAVNRTRPNFRDGMVADTNR